VLVRIAWEREYWIAIVGEACLDCVIDAPRYDMIRVWLAEAENWYTFASFEFQVLVLALPKWR
jgi:hypothetical protein